MKLAETKLARKAQLIELATGIYLKVGSMNGMVKFFEGIGKELEDEAKQLDAIDVIFDKVIVDEDGNKFEDLVGKKATDVLDLKTIQLIMEAIPKAITPDPK